MSQYDEAAAAKVESHLTSLSTLIRDIAHKHDSSDKTIESITKFQAKLTQEGKITSHNQQKLKGLYHNALKDVTQEDKLLRDALSTINKIRTVCNERRLQQKGSGHRETFHRGTLMKRLQISAQTLPLWVSKPGMCPPPLCGAIPAEPNYIAKPGDMVAAYVQNINATKDEEPYHWILAEVVSYNQSSNKYEIDDIDEEKTPKSTVSRNMVVPLPLMRANPETDSHALFAKGSHVMALYPQTTCFYKGLVQRLPKTALDDYFIIFADKQYEGGYAPPLKIAQQYVIDTNTKENKRRS